MRPVGFPSPPIAALPGPYLAHRRRTLQFLFVKASFCQDSLHLFQDRLICAVTLFRERETITPQKFAPVVAVLPRLLGPVFTCECQSFTIEAASRLAMVSRRALPRRMLTRARVENSERFTRKGGADDILLRTFGVFGHPHESGRLVT